LNGLTAIAIVLPPVIAGPMLLKDKPAKEIFLSESGSELFCAVIVDGNRNNKLKAIEVNKFCIVVTLN
jgi:hypothetical protein